MKKLSYNPPCYVPGCKRHATREGVENLPGKKGPRSVLCLEHANEWSASPEGIEYERVVVLTTETYGWHRVEMLDFLKWSFRLRAGDPKICSVPGCGRPKAPKKSYYASQEGFKELCEGHGGQWSGEGSRNSYDKPNVEYHGGKLTVAQIKLGVFGKFLGAMGPCAPFTKTPAVRSAIYVVQGQIVDRALRLERDMFHFVELANNPNVVERVKHEKYNEFEWAISSIESSLKKLRKDLRLPKKKQK